MIRRTLLTLLALVLVAGATACGGGAGGGGDESADESPGDDTTQADQADEPADEATTSSTADGREGGESNPGPAGTPGAVATRLGVDRSFTGEGSEAFCEEIVAVQESMEGTDPATVDDAAFADQMAAVTPPDEIAAEWTNLYAVQKAIASDPSGEALAALSEDDSAAWGEAGAVVAAYLGDVCGMS
jgi:hypothetical protein